MAYNGNRADLTACAVLEADCSLTHRPGAGCKGRSDFSEVSDRQTMSAAVSASWKIPSAFFFEATRPSSIQVRGRHLRNKPEVLVSAEWQLAVPGVPRVGSSSA